MKINNHTITTIVSDFDGTILKHGMQETPARFLEAVEELLNRGIHFVAASGRQYPNLKRLMAPVADRIGFICENGALIIWQGKVLYKGTIDRTLAMELIEDMKQQPSSEILVSGEGTSYIVPNTPEYAYLLEHVVKNVVTILEDFQEIQEDMIKISIHYPNGIPASAEQMFREKYGEKLLIVESGNGWLDFMAPGCGKGPALRQVADIMGFDLTQAAAFGDSENDISMLETAGIGFAMDTAREPVKAVANYVCESVEDILWEALD